MVTVILESQDLKICIPEEIINKSPTIQNLLEDTNETNIVINLPFLATTLADPQVLDFLGFNPKIDSTVDLSTLSFPLAVKGFIDCLEAGIEKNFSWEAACKYMNFPLFLDPKISFLTNLTKRKVVKIKKEEKKSFIVDVLITNHMNRLKEWVISEKWYLSPDNIFMGALKTKLRFVKLFRLADIFILEDKEGQTWFYKKTGNLCKAKISPEYKLVEVLEWGSSVVLIFAKDGRCYLVYDILIRNDWGKNIIEKISFKKIIDMNMYLDGVKDFYLNLNFYIIDKEDKIWIFELTEDPINVDVRFYNCCFVCSKADHQHFNEKIKEALILTDKIDEWAEYHLTENGNLLDKEGDIVDIRVTRLIRRGYVKTLI